MGWWKSSMFVVARGDFMPIIIGGIVLFLGVPSFLMVLFYPDSNAGGFGALLLAILGGCNLIGIALVIAGIRKCSTPGTLSYRLSHGRIFTG